MTENKK
jgi:hypothetical protein